MPGGDRAVVDRAKLLDYCLSTTHPRGRHKARLFAAATGITAVDADLLGDALRAAAATVDAVPTRRSEFGQMYEVTFVLDGPSGSAAILSVWIVLDGESVPRLVTCYPV